MRKIVRLSCVIEIDEIKLPKRKFNAVRVVKSPWVIVGVDGSSGNIFFKEVMYRNKETVKSVLMECVDVGITIILDCWVRYVN